jgi:hypothetical protein
MPSTLVIVYSYTGTSRRLADQLCSRQGWPMGEVLERRSRSGAAGLVRCVLDSLLRRRPPVDYRGPDPSNYDSVVLIAPIWAGRLASPMRSFAAERAASLPRVAMISVMGSRGAHKAAAEMGELLGRAPRLWTGITQHEVDDGSAAARMSAFGRAVTALAQRAEPAQPAGLSPQAA